MEDGELDPPWEDQLTVLFLELGRPDGRPDPEVLRSLQGFLLAASGLPLPSPDADDAAGGVVVALVTRLRSDPTTISHPAAYLRTAVRNAVAANSERRRRAEPVNPTEMAELVGALDSREEHRAQARDMLRQAFDSAAKAGDRQAVQVAIVWLDLDDELQRAPTSREVARVLHVSHTTVMRVLRRLRHYGDGGSPDA